MTRRIREFDWASTSLGTADEWPQSLKTAVLIVLGSRYPMFVWWGEQLINFYNDAYAPMLGNRHPLALGRSARDVWSDVWEIVGPQTDLVLKEGQSTWNDETLLVMTRYGYTEETYFTFSYSPVPDDAGSVGGVFCAVSEETQKVISRRRMRTLRELGAQALPAKTAEEACRMAAKALAGNAHDLPFVLIYLLGPDGRRATLMGGTGLPPDSPAGPQEIDLENPAGTLAQWPLKGLLTSCESQTVPDLPARFGRLPGGPWPEPTASAMLLPITEPGQRQLTGFIIAGISPRRQLDDDYKGFMELVTGQVATAISDARGYEAERKRAEALAELDRAKTAFFSNVSHEFRTPLTLMLGPVEDLLSRSQPELAPSAKAHLELVNRNGRRLLRLVNTLLDFSRIEAGRVQTVFEPTDLAALTVELASMFRAATDRAGLNLIVDCPKLPEPIFVDRDMWEKIVLNLVSNAFKFTFDGEIEVKLQAENASAVLTVRDTGVGIPTEEVPRLFDRFHRVHNVRSRTNEGTGIGLALVQELVKLHGGSIRAESRVGLGTKFTVSLPLVKHPLPSELLGGRRNAGSGSTSAVPFVEEALRWLPEGSPKEKILQPPPLGELIPIPPPTVESGGGPNRPRVIIADDNADMRHYLARLLGEHYDLKVVSDGHAVLAEARESQPDLILSDVMMPGLDGVGLVQELRADAALKTIPIILLSARAGEESRVEGLLEGADDYLIKPFSARELLARVGVHLQMARLRKESAEQIRESENRYLTLFNSLIEGFCVVEVLFDAAGRPNDYRFLEVNPAFERHTGLHNAQGKLMRELAPEHEDKWFEIYGKIALTGEPERFVSEAKALNRWYEVCAFRVGGTESRKVAILFTDITEQKLVQDELFAANQRLEALMHALPVGVSFSDDLSCQRITGNPCALAQFEATAQDNLSASAPHPDDAGRQVQFFQNGRLMTDADLPLQRAVAENRPVASMELEVHLPSGKRWFADASGAPIRDAEGNVIAGVAVCVDVTERKRAEELLRAQASLLNLAHDAIIVLGPEARITFWNNGAEQTYGWSRDEAIGRVAHELLRTVFPKTLGELTAELTQKGAWEGELSHITKDGRQIVVASRWAAQRDASGKQIGVLEINRDISERKRFEQALKTAQLLLKAHAANLEKEVAERTMKLQETIGELEHFSYTITHDMRAPLRAMQGFADLLQEECASLAPGHRHYLELIMHASKRMDVLITDALQYSRIVGTQITLAPVQPTPLLRGIVESYPLLQTPNLEIVIEEPLPLLMANEAWLNQCFSNLLTNAVKFVAPGIKPRVRIWAETADRVVRLWFEDNGIGIKPEHHQRIFGMFQQLSRDYEGTGIGLALVRKAAERMGGRAGVESELGKGSRFWLEFQLAEKTRA